MTGVCGQGMSNVFAAPPIKYFKIFLGYQSLNITLTLTLYLTDKTVVYHLNPIGSSQVGMLYIV